MVYPLIFFQFIIVSKSIYLSISIYRYISIELSDENLQVAPVGGEPLVERDGVPLDILPVHNSI